MLCTTKYVTARTHFLFNGLAGFVLPDNLLQQVDVFSENNTARRVSEQVVSGRLF